MTTLAIFVALLCSSVRLWFWFSLWFGLRPFDWLGYLPAHIRLLPLRQAVKHAKFKNYVSEALFFPWACTDLLGRNIFENCINENADSASGVGQMSLTFTHAQQCRTEAFGNCHLEC